MRRKLKYPGKYSAGNNYAIKYSSITCDEYELFEIIESSTFQITI